ncbi:unnamed protein product [Mytilus edulis]|uniref:Uncharacterized protein n=1 Tax=Mytilus edulis TaxID=6550 RepID=A0A8S3QXN8_MYTED|nr:unnamed protein product [Mytilus edulis]
MIIQITSSSQCKDKFLYCDTKYPTKKQCTTKSTKKECMKYCGVCTDAVTQASSSRKTTTLYQTISKETTTLQPFVITSPTSTSQYRTTNQKVSRINRLSNSLTPFLRMHGNCPCTCRHRSNWTALGSYSERQDLRIKLKGKLEKTEKNLKMTKETLSAFLRTKTSARDNRTSSVVMGTVGSIVFGSVVIFILILDLLPSYKPTRNK